MILRTASFAELDTATLYALLRLRSEVFVVEQECPYLDLDGRDLEPATRHLWFAGDDGAPLAYLRVLRDDERTWRIGRVCTAKTARGQGLSSRLLALALEPTALEPTAAFVLDAQSYLIDFYAGFGFVASGPEYLEDGIAHTPMRRERTRREG